LSIKCLKSKRSTVFGLIAGIMFVDQVLIKSGSFFNIYLGLA